ncbi:MAG: phosphatase PAP2 family protein [Coleofasciculus sp. C1-SOL-03]|jgi:undecaprenyl-diphosphatase|uniref:phosphatase PAP2 family protein n=1 Tax=Coleofasciculus sp. C1-SOL-03 TaxID=3069522 RepID=UPI0033020BCB
MSTDELSKRIQSFWKFLVKLLISNWRSLVILFLGVYVPVQIFGELAEEIWKNEGGFPWDVPILLAIHSTTSPQLDAFAINLTKLGAYWGVFPLAVAIVLVLAFRRQWRFLTYALITYLGSLIINRTAKLTFQRVRPSLWESPAPESDYAFPSGHAMGSVTFAIVLIILTWNTRWRWLTVVGGIVFAIAIGWTRMYLGVHYPSDIIAGWMASIAWAVGVSLVIRPYRSQRRLEKEEKEVTETS